MFSLSGATACSIPDCSNFSTIRIRPPHWLIQRRRQTWQALVASRRERTAAAFVAGRSSRWTGHAHRTLHSMKPFARRSRRVESRRSTSLLATGTFRSLRRQLRPFWFPAPAPEQRKAAERLLLDAAQKGIARFSGDGPRADRKLPHLPSLEDSDHAQSANRLDQHRRLGSDVSFRYGPSRLGNDLSPSPSASLTASTASWPG